VVKFFLIFGALASILIILGLYALKIAYQYQYLRLKNRLKKTDLFEAWSLTLKSDRDKKLRNQAVMLFPMFFPIDLDDTNESMLDIKRTLKKLHIYIYIALMGIMLIGVYTSKAYPNGIFAS
jgi:hypothetical protein